MLSVFSTDSKYLLESMSPKDRNPECMIPLTLQKIMGLTLLLDAAVINDFGCGNPFLDC